MSVGGSFSRLGPLSRAWVRLRTQGVAGWLRSYRSRLLFFASLLGGLLLWLIARAFLDEVRIFPFWFIFLAAASISLAVISRNVQVSALAQKEDSENSESHLRPRSVFAVRKELEFALLVCGPLIAITELALRGYGMALVISLLISVGLAWLFVSASVKGSKLAFERSKERFSQETDWSLPKLIVHRARAIQMIDAGLCPACEQPLMSVDGEHGIGCVLCSTRLYGWCADALCGASNLILYQSCSSCGGQEPIKRKTPCHPIEREYEEFAHRKSLKTDHDQKGS
jgi:hypothetical protein